MDDDGFILVSSKKGKGKSKTNKTSISTTKDIRINLKNEETNTLIDEKGFCEKLQREEIELRHSEFFTKFTLFSIRNFPCFINFRSYLQSCIC